MELMLTQLTLEWSYVFILNLQCVVTQNRNSFNKKTWFDFYSDKVYQK